LLEQWYTSSLISVIKRREYVHFSFVGTCNETSDTTFHCACEAGWEGIHCETIINYCQNVLCQNNGVCRSLFRNFTCECLGESYSGRFCEITASKTVVHQKVSRSLGYIAILAITSLAMFVISMDTLKYCFGIDPVREDLERIRQKKQAMKTKRKPIIQRFIYVNAPPSEQLTSDIKETSV
jgi:hypothetical protein